MLLAGVSLALFAQDADRFRELVRDHDVLPALREAAAQWEGNEHDPARHLVAVEEIARALLDRDPTLSLDYCRRVRSAPQLWPIMLDAEARLRDWPMAERYGEAVIEEIDAGRLFSRLADAPEESRMRRLYAAALEHDGKAEAAARQMAIVNHGVMNGPFNNEAIRGQGAAVAAVERARRIANLRSEVLAGEIDAPSAPFRLPDLNGRQVALADYRGKPLVAVFWASWCAPCVAELRVLNGFFERYPGRFLTISTDSDRETAAHIARKNGYHFPILWADRSAKLAYTPAPTLEGPNVPQLYVFDAQGRIRFHVLGFDDDGMLAQKVEWMVKAAIK